MLWLAVCAVSLAIVGLLAYWLPVSLHSNLQARAEPAGSWALALGIGIGPLAFSAILARGVEPFLTCHVFGKQLARLPLSRWRRGRPKKLDPGGLEPSAKGLNFSAFERSMARFFRDLDPIDALLSWWEKARVFEVRLLEIDVEYSFGDVALTGQILAALYMLIGVLPERFVINQTPSWASEDRLALTADGQFRIWPVRLVVDVLGFVLKERARARRRSVPAGE